MTVFEVLAFIFTDYNAAWITLTVFCIVVIVIGIILWRSGK